MDKTKQFIALECYKPWCTVDLNNETVSYKALEEARFYTKIRLDMIARVDSPSTFIATPLSRNPMCFDPERDEHLEVVYQRVVVLCPTSRGANGFHDSLYITERCIKRLEKIWDEVFGPAL